jgi:hypothetical protein
MLLLEAKILDIDQKSLPQTMPAEIHVSFSSLLGSCRYVGKSKSAKSKWYVVL